MKLRHMTGDDTRVTMWLDGDPARLVTVRCKDAVAVGRQLAMCVNFHDPMVAALRMFSSKEMGSLLTDVVVNSFEDEEQGAEVEERLRALVNAVDVIIKGVELIDPGDKGGAVGT